MNISAVRYACAIWTLKETTTRRLMVFQRKVLRKIFSPTNENGIWRIKTNHKLDKIIKHKNIIDFIRAQRLGWLVTLKRCKKQECSRQYTPGNPFQEDQRRYAESELGKVWKPS
jgi:hypothetical protein